MLIYQRKVPAGAGRDAFDVTVVHVVDHLSSIASPTDGGEFGPDVVITREDQDDGSILVVGQLDREADAPYLRADFDPEQDVADNPLSVQSIDEGQ
ncbi:hypothetical protein DMH04_41250 [Kibdelosporangium aridum]|uniref:Uncharacterized protein n=1 Tax=Kibdelosporangium aridum TaxID=2030 RepID=A0A428YUY0_KIBAR|nr:hypothetical protein [Kibdelosporangium aridum]RSM73441.1 hypothetical protein DMH04_41250 [Kibdelosporangium aridum]